MILAPLSINNSMFYGFPLSHIHKGTLTDQKPAFRNFRDTKSYFLVYFSKRSLLHLDSLETFHLSASLPFTNPYPRPSNPHPHPWGETLLVDKFSSSVIQCSLTHFSPVLPLPLSLTLFASLSGHLSQEACWTDRWKALTFTQNNNKLLTLFSNVTFHLYAMEVTSNCLIITLELPL